MNRRPFHYAYYLLPVLAVLILLLLLNGYFEIQRTRTQLFNLLETEGQLLIRGMETNATNLIKRFQDAGRRLPARDLQESLETDPLLGLEDLMIERLVDLGLRLDQEAAKKPEDPEQRRPVDSQNRIDAKSNLWPSPGKTRSVKAAPPGVC